MSVSTRTFKPLLCLRPLFFNQKRNSTRESIHRHTEPHKFKKHMLSACEPYFKRKYEPMWETCKGTKPKKIDLLPLEEILTRELVEDIQSSDFILYIQYNYTPFLNERPYKNTITKSGGKFQNLNNKIYREALKVLHYDEGVRNLFNYSRHALITGLIDDLPKCIQVLRKMPHFIFLGGSINKHTYTADYLKTITSTTDINQSRANLLSILETPSIELSSHLEQHCEAIKPQHSTSEPSDM